MYSMCGFRCECVVDRSTIEIDRSTIEIDRSTIENDVFPSNFYLSNLTSHQHLLFIVIRHCREVTPAAPLPPPPVSSHRGKKGATDREVTPCYLHRNPRLPQCRGPPQISRPESATEPPEHRRSAPTQQGRPWTPTAALPHLEGAQSGDFREQKQN